MYFLIFAKVFETVNHNILFRKVAYYGIRGNILEWIHNYLSNMQQRCNVMEQHTPLTKSHVVEARCKDHKVQFGIRCSFLFI